MNTKTAMPVLVVVLLGGVGLGVWVSREAPQPPPEAKTTAPPPRTKTAVAKSASLAPPPTKTTAPPKTEVQTPVAQLAGAALRARVRDIVRRGMEAEEQEDQEAAGRAGRELMALVREVSGRGAKGIAEATALLEAGQPSLAQVTGIRILAAYPHTGKHGRAASEKLADASFDAKLSADARLQALRKLRSRDSVFAQGAISDVAQDTKQKKDMRRFAMDQLTARSASILEDVARDTKDLVEVRGHALTVLFRLDRARARDVWHALQKEKAMAKVLAKLDELAGED